MCHTTTMTYIYCESALELLASQRSSFSTPNASSSTGSPVPQRARSWPSHHRPRLLRGLGARHFGERIPLCQAATALALEQVLLSRNDTLTSLSQNPLNVFGCAHCMWYGDFANMKFYLRSVSSDRQRSLG
ncbi:hypothetical protein LXA43DRAFT_730358 [Ganoderma leucocontextum]|nr:hypothetical protein LXA43DRAFT_730358 [Ganoderma leucocontextum]